MTPAVVDTRALAGVSGGAGGAETQLSPHAQALQASAVSYLEHNVGGTWQRGAAHHQGLTMSSYVQAGDPTPYMAVFANNGDHTARVLVNNTTGEAVRRLP